MTSDRSQTEQVDASKARRSLRNGFITLVLTGTLVVGLLLAVPGLKGVATTVSHMKVQWVAVAILLEICRAAATSWRSCRCSIGRRGGSEPG